jgi:hypothetical protein
LEAKCAQILKCNLVICMYIVYVYYVACAMCLNRISSTRIREIDLACLKLYVVGTYIICNSRNMCNKLI